MPLSINPLAQLVANVSQSINQATNAAQAQLPNVASTVSKAGLDSKISQLSGELGSGLNGLSGNLKDLSGTAMGGLGSQATSSVSGAINTLQSVTGSTSNIAADISGSLNKLTGGNLAGGLQSLAGTISSAAGALNNILSLKRGINIPSGAEAFQQQGQAIRLNSAPKNDWRVRINCQWNVFNSPLFTRLEETGGVVWPFNPTITVTTKADYQATNPVHSNYTIHSYKSSSVDDISISGEFSCETETDAAYWIAATTFFKTATKMFYGQGELAGSPPLICNLSGYGSSVFDSVPVIIKSFTVDLRDDVDYINCNVYGTNTWVPILSTISVTVAPIYNRSRMRQFSLSDYASGGMAMKNSGGGIGYI